MKLLDRHSFYMYTRFRVVQEVRSDVHYVMLCVLRRVRPLFCATAASGSLGL